MLNHAASWASWADQSVDGRAGSASPPPGSASPPPGFVAPPPPAQPPVAVALLNLSGFGLGYVLMRCRVWVALCWIASLISRRAGPGGRGRGAGRAAAGGRRVVAAVGGSGGRAGAAGDARGGKVVAYGSAQDEAVEQMLLDRLDRGDRSVEAASGKSFAEARGDCQAAFAVYRDLGEKHAGSRAGKLVPKQLDAYYEAVSAPYRRKELCGAIEPLTRLRTVPRSIDRKLLGDLAGYPDGPLAASLYACGVSKAGCRAEGRRGQRRTGRAATYVPGLDGGREGGAAVSRKISEQNRAVRGGDPCAARDALQRLRTAALRQSRRSPGEAGHQQRRPGRSGDPVHRAGHGKDERQGVRQLPDLLRPDRLPVRVQFALVGRRSGRLGHLRTGRGTVRRTPGELPRALVHLVDSWSVHAPYMRRSSPEWRITCAQHPAHVIHTRRPTSQGVV